MTEERRDGILGLLEIEKNVLASVRMVLMQITDDEAEDLEIKDELKTAFNLLARLDCTIDIDMIRKIEVTPF